MRHVQDNAEEAVRRVIDALDDGEYRYETDSGAVIRVRVAVDRENRSATVDFTGTSPQLATNFNAPTSGGQRRRPVRLPHPRRRRHPAQRRLPAAPAASSSRRARCSPRTAGGRRRGQRRDLTGDHRRAVRRAGRPGRGLRHHEQRHLRQRPAPVLRDRRLRLGRGRRVRRSVRRADPHDQLAAHRPRGPGVATSPFCSRSSPYGAAAAGRDGGAAGTARYAGSGSSSR